MTFRSEFQEGLFNGVAESVYRADSALSTSDLKGIGNPYEFQQKMAGKYSSFDTTSMRTGRLYHMYALEPDRWTAEVATCPDEFSDKRKKASKEWWAKQANKGVTIIKEEDLEAIQAMHKNLMDQPMVGECLEEGETEVSVFAKNIVKGVDAKCRIDCLYSIGRERTVVDIKTTRKGGSSPREFKMTSRRLKYHWQEANYRRIAHKAGYPISDWLWAVVETEPPYTASVYRFSKHDLLMANTELDEAYSKLKSCLDLNAWPGYTPTEPLTLNIYDSV
jgi:Fe-S cluster biosynthesis and repair protein YggX|tara:strand:+ start:893 stop:1723 length:831 start_codon:yes stop_codon:yes gene_type:complete